MVGLSVLAASGFAGMSNTLHSDMAQIMSERLHFELIHVKVADIFCLHSTQT